MASPDFPLSDPHAPTRPHQEDPVSAEYYSNPFIDAESDPEKSASETPARRNPYYCSPIAGNNPTKRHRPNGNLNFGESGTGSTPESRSDYRKDREEWSDVAIDCLLDAYTEKFNQLNRGNLRGRDWEEVAEAVSEGSGGGDEKIGQRQRTWKSVEQCKNKIDNLKKRYKVELQRMSSSGMSSSHWHWFKKIEAIMGNPDINTVAESEERGGAPASCNVTKQAKRHIPTNSSFTNNLKSKPLQTLKWRRVVFKISGTALAGNCRSIDPKVAMQIAREVATACRQGVEVAIVVGGRNFFCGDSWVSATGLDRPTAYQIGMMATVMNSILLQSAFEKLGVQTRVQSAFSLPEVAEPYSRQRTIRHLEKGRVVIFGGVGAGTGNPLFTTDTAAALRAFEINAEAVLKGTNFNGIYDCQSGNGNIMLDHISFREAATRGITSIDTMAVTYCEDNGIPVVVFNMHEPGNISRALCGELSQSGTMIDHTGQIA